MTWLIPNQNISSFVNKDLNEDETHPMSFRQRVWAIEAYFNYRQSFNKKVSFFIHHSFLPTLGLDASHKVITLYNVFFFNGGERGIVWKWFNYKIDRNDCSDIIWFWINEQVSSLDLEIWLSSTDMCWQVLSNRSRT